VEELGDLQVVVKVAQTWVRRLAKALISTGDLKDRGSTE